MITDLIFEDRQQERKAKTQLKTIINYCRLKLNLNAYIITYITDLLLECG